MSNIDNFDEERNKNLTAIVFMAGFMAVLIALTVIILNIKNKSAKEIPPTPTETVDVTETATPTPETNPVPFDDLVDSLFNDISQMLTCNDIHYFAATTPGVFMSDLADARTTLGKCEAMSYSVWYSSSMSTALTKGHYMLNVTLSGSTSGYDELLVYFYVQEYNNEYSIESISFDYITID